MKQFKNFKKEKMKELQDQKIDKTEVRAEVPDDREVLVDPTKLHPGHTLFQMDLKTFVITEVQYEQVNYSLLSMSVRKKITVKPGFRYAAALNFKNADKKFHKMYGLKMKKK